MNFYHKLTGNKMYLPNIELELIANLVETDKASCDCRNFSWSKNFPTHCNLGYVKQYTKYMESLRTSPVKFLEIGVLDHRFPLASVKMWMSYFQLIDLYCFDKFVILPYGKISDWIKQLNLMGANVIHADQGSRSDWRELENIVSGFDFIIDDGSHLSKHIMISLISAFKLLKNGGLYFIEDVQNPKKSAGMWGYNNADCIAPFQEFQKTGVFQSPYFSTIENKIISSTARVVDIVLDEQQVNYLVILEKSTNKLFI